MSGIFTWFIQSIVWDILKISIEWAARNTRMIRPIPDWEGRINRHFSGEFHILKGKTEEPNIIYDGEYILTEE